VVYLYLDRLQAWLMGKPERRLEEFNGVHVAAAE
jgi:hypothetical protein